MWCHSTSRLGSRPTNQNATFVSAPGTIHTRLTVNSRPRRARRLMQLTLTRPVALAHVVIAQQVMRSTTGVRQRNTFDPIELAHASPFSHSGHAGCVCGAKRPSDERSVAYSPLFQT